MLKVLIVGPAHPLRGGLATFDERLCRAFSDQGHSAEILSFKLQYPEFLFPGTTQFSSEPAPTDLIIHSEINSVNPLNWWKVGRTFRANDYDLVIFRYWMPFMGPALGTIARLLKKSKRTKIVAICDNLIPHEKRPGDSLFTHYFVKPLDGMLTMSKSVLSDIERIFPEKKRTYLPHPMYDSFGPAYVRETALQSLSLDPSFRYLLFFGFIRKYKGLDTLIRLMAEPELASLPLKALVAGEFYEPAEPYLQLIADLGVADKIELRTQFIPDSEVSKYFSAADMVVQPYHSATQSGVTQIAYFYGVPMLVTDVGGLAELVPHEKVGFVCNQSTAEMAACIARFYRENMQQNMRDEVVKHSAWFSWDRMVKALIEL